MPLFLAATLDHKLERTLSNHLACLRNYSQSMHTSNLETNYVTRSVVVTTKPSKAGLPVPANLNIRKKGIYRVRKNKVAP